MSANGEKKESAEGPSREDSEIWADVSESRDSTESESPRREYSTEWADVIDSKDSLESQNAPRENLVTLAKGKTTSVSSVKSNIKFIRKNDPVIREEDITSEETQIDQPKAKRIKKFAKTRPQRDSLASVSSINDAQGDVVSSSELTSELPVTLKKSPSVSSNKLNTDLRVGDVFVYVIVPPDGGYGWVVMVISFLCQVIVDGLVFSIGIVMPNMAADLNVSPKEIVLVVSIQIGCYFLSGPISSACINKYGFRTVALLGAGISCVSVLIATFSPNLQMLILFYSVIGGPTLSMVWVSSQLIIGYYFEKYRPLAYGLSVSGAGIGILIASALNSAVIDDLGWRNTLRIHCCLLVITIFMGLTYIEVKPTKVGQLNQGDFVTETEDSDQVLYLKTHRYSKTSTIKGSRESLPELTEILVEFKRPPVEQSRCCASKCCNKRRLSLTGDNQMGDKAFIMPNDLLERQDVYYTGPANYVASSTSPTIVAGRVFPLDKKEKQSVQYRISVMQFMQPSGSRRRTLRQLKATSRHPYCAYIAPSNWLPTKITNAFNLLFDFRLLEMAEFQILLASAFFFPMGFNIPFVYSKMRADVPESYAIFISPTIGFSNFVFRVISGFIAYKYKASTTYVCGGGLIFGGVAVFVSAFYGVDLVWFQFVYAFCYGVAPALYSTLRAIIYVQALGLVKLTNAFGLTGMAMGLGVFIGTSLAGFLNEVTESYSASFAFSGCCMVLAGLLKVLLPAFIKRKEAKMEKSHRVTFHS